MASLAAAAAVPDPVESRVTEIVRAYGAWLKNPTTDVFESLGHRWHPVKSASSGVDITVRLTNLGFNAMLCPVVAGGDMRFDVWMHKSQRVDPASELGRMLGLPVPSPTPQADKVQAAVADVNSQFTRWLLHHADGSADTQTSSPTFRVQVDELSASECALLRNVLVPHGWRVASHHVGASTTLGVSRATPFSCPRNGFLSQQLPQ